MMDEALDRDAFLARDARDPLAYKRAEFFLPRDCIYLDGNSLGCMPRGATDHLQTVLTEQWAQGLIGSWVGADWIGLPLRVGDKIARLIGARPGEVIAGDTTSINYYKALFAALALRPERNVIVTEKSNFPTDLYIAQSLAAQFGKEIRMVDAPDVYDAIDENVAVVGLTHVNYKTADIFDMTRINALAHDAGALTVWDLAHTAGALPCALNDAHSDFAVGCGYKYLNGGPGAPAFLFVANRHQLQARQPLTGWFGHARPFAFEQNFVSASDISKFQCGTPSVVALSLLDRALDVFADVSLDDLAEKSRAMTCAFIALYDRMLAPLGFCLASSREDAKRGSHVAIRHEDGYPIMRALADDGFVGDFRAPDLMRFGFAPLYNQHVDVFNLVQAIEKIMRTRAWDRPEYFERRAVT
jgi:kynureninase